MVSRTLPQAQERAQHMLFGSTAEIDARAPIRELNPKVLSRRLEGRRVCPECLTVYRIDSNPRRWRASAAQRRHPADRSRRRQTDVVQKATTYQETMAPLIAYFAQLGNFEKTVDTSGSIDEATKAVIDPDSPPL